MVTLFLRFLWHYSCVIFLTICSICLLFLYFIKFLSCLKCLAKCWLFKQCKQIKLPKLKGQLTKISENWSTTKIRIFFLHLKQNWKKVWSQRLQSLWSINTTYHILLKTPSTFFKIRVMYLELSRQNTKSIHSTLILYVS